MKKFFLLSSMSSFVVRGVFLIFLFTFVFLLPILNDAGAVTPSTNEIQKLLASDAAAGDLFGFIVSISGDRAIVGAHRDDDNGSDSGSAYVFERDAMGNWKEVDKLTASDAAADDLFGISVSISGDRAIVGALFHDDNGSDSGSAYVFERVWGTGTR